MISFKDDVLTSGLKCFFSLDNHFIILLQLHLPVFAYLLNNGLSSSANTDNGQAGYFQQ